MRAPGNTHRTLIIGRTGTGKTVAGAWHLSRASFDRKPWIIFDFKRDELLNSFRAEEMALEKSPPKKPGLYIVHPMPSEAGKVDRYLWQVWQNENTGVFVDEGFMMAGGDAFEALLTQGRSKKIPMLVLTQRPVWISRFCFSESDFIQVFDLTDYRDRDTVQPFMTEHDLDDVLPDYHSIWQDVGKGEAAILKPVETPSRIRHRIRARVQDRLHAL